MTVTEGHANNAPYMHCKCLAFLFSRGQPPTLFFFFLISYVRRIIKPNFYLLIVLIYIYIWRNQDPRSQTSKKVNKISRSHIYPNSIQHEDLKVRGQDFKIQDQDIEVIYTRYSTKNAPIKPETNASLFLVKSNGQESSTHIYIAPAT